MSFHADAAKIKRWREERHWSQEHLAELAGIGLRTIQRIENGDPASPESLKALAAAYNVDVIALAVDQEVEAATIIERKNAKTKAALRLGFLINLASYAFGLIVFTGISLSDGVDGYAMLLPAIWWGVGVAGFGLTLVIVELSMHYKQKDEPAG